MSVSASLPLHQSIHHHHQSPLPLNSPAHQKDPKLIMTHETLATPFRVTYPLQVLMELVRLLTVQVQLLLVSQLHCIIRPEVTSTHLDLTLHLSLSPHPLWECLFHHLHLLPPGVLTLPCLCLQGWVWHISIE